MRWSEIDGDLVRLPADRMKSGKPGFLVLSSFALSIVASLPRTHEEFVFPTPYKPRSGTRGDVRPGRAGRGTISGFTPAHNATMKRTGITGWVPHDTRRTFATGLVRLGAPPHVADAAINHAAPLLVRTYQVHTHEAEIRRWAEAWGAHVKALLTR
jgi:integrase